MMIITYPPTLAQLEENLASFAVNAVNSIYLKIFRGMFGGELYPAAFSQEERGLLLRLGLPKKECDILGGAIHFRNHLSFTGCRTLDMDQDGNLSRCSTLRESRGNLFLGDCRLDRRPAPCSAETCACPYQGLKFTTPRTPSSSWMNTLRYLRSWSKT